MEKEVAEKEVVETNAANLTTEELTRYYRKEPEATNRAILRFLRDTCPDTVVFGSRAINAHLPEWLRKETTDWDIVSTKSAKRMASKLEKALDARYGGDFFVVEPAKHEGTFKVRSRVTKQGVADISPKSGRIDFKAIRGVNYATLEFQEKEALRILGESDKAFRHGKDRDTLQRIEVYRQSKKERKKRRDSAGVLGIMKLF